MSRQNHALSQPSTWFGNWCWGIGGHGQFVAALTLRSSAVSWIGTRMLPFRWRHDEIGKFRNLGSRLRASLRFSDGQPPNRGNLRRVVGLARENRCNRGASSAGIDTSDKREVSGGLPCAKLAASCFAPGSNLNGLKSSASGWGGRNLPASSGIKQAKNESTFSLGKRKLATKAKSVPPKTMLDTPRATVVSTTVADRPAFRRKPARPTVHVMTGCSMDF